MLYLNTNTLDGLIDDLPMTKDQEQAKVVLLGGKPIDLEKFPNVQGLFRAGVGHDNVPWEDAKARNIEIVFPSAEAAKIIHAETANFACHLILTMMYVKAGELDDWKKHPRSALNQKKLLVIGTGNIGRRVVEQMQTFMQVLTYDALTNTLEELPALLKQADVVSLHLPLLPETRDFLDASRLALLRDGTAIVNTARGAVVNEQSLLREIRQGRLCAAFDVFWQEPYNGPLTSFHPDRFYMTPHIASTCREFLESTANDLRVFCQKFGL